MTVTCMHHNSNNDNHYSKLYYYYYYYFGNTRAVADGLSGVVMIEEEESLVPDREY